ncbi:MAG: DUF4338 domain-containing protein [Candidatus Eisenbacteria bacterium]|nr:DUF4338 domain-containing protein [Candidatus Eisenbacteria bacterium]
MDLAIRYRGRTFGADKIDFIRQLIADHPTASRKALSRKLCETWNWVQSNGNPCDMVARGLLLLLHRAGHIELPAKRCAPPNNVIRRQRPEPLPFLTWNPIESPLSDLRPLEFHQVRRTGEEAVFDSFIESHHYLGYMRPVGEHLKFLIYARGIPVACMAWSSAPRHIGCRDRFIGWSPEARRRNIRFLAYNTRYLILPWVHVKDLASHLLSRMARRISADWEQLYSHPIHFLETFVDRERFRGTCYRAANWIFLGLTTGRGKADQTNKPNRSLKESWGYPLSPRFREILGRLG